MIENISINTQSSVRIAASKIIYVDPYLINEEKHDADIVFITHEHYDHLSKDDYEKVANEHTVFVVPKALEKFVTGKNVEALSVGETKELLGISVETIPAYNLTKSFHKKEFGWVGYILTVDGETMYFAGDTDNTPEAQAVRCDTCFLPIGGTYTMTASEASKLANTIRPKRVIPYHYGSIVGSKADEVTFRELVDKDIEVKVVLKV